MTERQEVEAEAIRQTHRQTCGPSTCQYAELHRAIWETGDARRAYESEARTLAAMRAIVIDTEEK